MRRIIFGLKNKAVSALLFYFVLIVPSIVRAAPAAGSTDPKASCRLSLLWDASYDKTKYHKQILGVVPNEGVKVDGSALWAYIQSLHNTIMPYIFFAAIIYVVFSGIQYMLSGYTPGLEKEAKQRIIGVVMGVLFYMVMVSLYNWFVCDVASI